MELVKFIVIVTLGIAVWCGWMYFCLCFWIKRWAKKNSFDLENYAIRWFRRGPYWYTFFPFLGGPVYRVTIRHSDKCTREGWVWLSPGYFFGGKGKVTWD